MHESSKFFNIYTSMKTRSICWGRLDDDQNSDKKINLRSATNKMWTESVDWHVVLTTAGFILSMRTMWGEVTHFALLNTLPSVTGKPWGRAHRRRRTEVCQKRDSYIQPFHLQEALWSLWLTHIMGFFFIGTYGRLIFISSIQIKSGTLTAPWKIRFACKVMNEVRIVWSIVDPIS